MRTILRFDGRRLVPVEHEPVREVRFALHVNGKMLATLVCSPHDLQYLVTGFLRLKGLVRTLDDFLSMNVRPEENRADVRIATGTWNHSPAAFKPVRGTKTGHQTNGHTKVLEPRPSAAGPAVTPGEIFRLAHSVARASRRSRKGLEIDFAAAGDGGRLLLFAEDIGGRNAIDRIAGEALLRQIDLSGKILLTSGRISADVVGKAALLGVAAMASLVQPTDLACRMCDERGITLIRCERGGRFDVYARPERILLKECREKNACVTGAILAGGSSSRMGSNKALLPLQGGRFIEAIHRRVAEIFEEVVVVTNSPELFDFLPCRKVPDLIPGMGALSGIHSALVHSRTPHVFVVGCDMPHLVPELIRHIACGAEGFDVVIPESDKGLEPLHAVYGRNAIPAIEEALHAGRAQVASFFDRVRVKRIARREVEEYDPAFASFRNINTPEDYFHLREEEAKNSSRDPSKTLVPGGEQAP